MYLLLAMMWLQLCYNTTNMETVLLDYPNEQQILMLTSEQKISIQDNVSIYNKEVTQIWLYLCLRE